MEMDKSEDNRELCDKCGKEIEKVDYATWWNEIWVEQARGYMNVVHKKRHVTYWKHKNGGLFDNESGCGDPTPRNKKSTLVQCVRCNRMFDFTKEGEKWYDRKNGRLMAKCGSCSVYVK